MHRPRLRLSSKKTGYNLPYRPFHNYRVPKSVNEQFFAVRTRRSTDIKASKLRKDRSGRRTKLRPNGWPFFLHARKTFVAHKCPIPVQFLPD